MAQIHPINATSKDPIASSPSSMSPSDRWKSTISKMNRSAYQSLARGHPFVNDYEVLGWLGRGGFGSVAHVRNKLEDKEYAVKIIPIHAKDERQVTENKYIQEARTLAQVSTGHVNVIRFYHSWVEPVTPELKKQITYKDGDLDEDELDSAFSSQYSFSVYDDSLTDLKPTLSPTRDIFDTNPFSVFDMSFDSPQLTIPVTEDIRSPESLILSPVFSDSPWSNSDSNLSETTEETSSGNEIPAIATDICEDEPSYILFLQMELCTAQTLREWIDERTAQTDHPFDLQERLDIFYQVLSAIEHIHHQGFIHRDIKPGNIFMTEDGSVKVGDFGLSALYNSHSQPNPLFSPRNAVVGEDHTSGVGTYLYAAPEQLQENSKYGVSVDVFALGVVFFELLHPFDTGMERASVLQEVREGKLPQTFVDEYHKISDIVISCVSSPESRPPVSKLLANDMFQRHQTKCEQNMRTQFAVQLQTKDDIIISQGKTIKELREILAEKDTLIDSLRKQLDKSFKI